MEADLCFPYIGFLAKPKKLRMKTSLCPPVLAWSIEAQGEPRVGSLRGDALRLGRDSFLR